MAYFVARVVREYGMGYFDVLKLPLVTFWSFNRQVDRLRAETEQRQLRILIAADSPQAGKELSEKLSTEIGMPLIVEKKLDTKKYDELAEKFRRQRVVSDTHTE